MMEMSVRFGLIAAAVVACVGLTACSGATSGETEPEAGSSETDTTSSSPPSATSEAEVPGERVSVSVASFVLPEGVKWTEKVISDTAKVDFRKWYATYPGTDEPSCEISVSAESDVGDSAVVLLLEEAKQMRKKHLQSAEMDPTVPEDVVGTVVTYGGPFTAEDGSKKSFSSTVRQWQTPGNTLIGISVNTNDDGPTECDPDAVAATLQWNGEERVMEESG